MSGDVLSPLVPASSILENTEIPTIIADDDGLPADLRKSHSVTLPHSHPSSAAYPYDISGTTPPSNANTRHVHTQALQGRTLSDGSGFARGHAKRSSFGKISDGLREAFARASSGGSIKSDHGSRDSLTSNNNGNNGGSNNGGRPEQGHSRHLSTQSLGYLPSASLSKQASADFSLQSSSAPVPNTNILQKSQTISRVESHPLSVGDSSDSQSEKNVRVHRTPSPRKHSFLAAKAESFSAAVAAVPRSQENTGIIGRMADEPELLQRTLTVPTRPPSPATSTDDRSFVGTLPGPGQLSYANKKRDQDFHDLFPNVPEDEALVEDYACALQKDILVQGRLYLTEQRVCFYANIFSWTTTIYIPFADIQAIEKRAVLMISNAIEIITKEGKKYFFASFMTRDPAHALMHKLWKRDVEMSSTMDLHFDETDHHSDYESEHHSVFTEDPDDHLASIDENQVSGDLPRTPPSGEEGTRTPTASPTELSPDGGGDGVSPPKSRSTVASPTTVGGMAVLTTTTNQSFGSLGPSSSGRKQSVVLHTPSVVSASSTSHATHGHHIRRRHHHGRSGSSRSHKHEDIGPLPKPSSCDCTDHEKYTVNLVKTYDIALHKIWKLMFGRGSEKTVQRAITELRKNRDFRVDTPWSLNGQPVQGESDDSITNGAKRTLVWVCPLNSSLGPKQTRNVHEEVILHKDLSLSVTVETFDMATDVPAGDCFKVHEKICLMNADPVNNRPRTTVKLSGRVEFHKSTWLKSVIEKNALEGVKVYFEDVDKLIRELIANAAAVGGEEGAGRSERRKSREEKVESAVQEVPATPAPSFASPGAFVEGTGQEEAVGIMSIVAGLVVSLARYLAGEDEPVVRRVGTAVLSALAVVVFFSYMLLLWRLASTLGQINETLLAIRQTLPANR